MAAMMATSSCVGATHVAFAAPMRISGHAQNPYSTRAPAVKGFARSSTYPRRCIALQAVAAQKSKSTDVQQRAADAPTPEKIVEGDWYALVASAEFFFRGAQNEALPEQLRELKRYYDEKGRGQDFYIVSQPHWLDAKFPNEAKKVRRPAAALISTDKAWITFMKLRLDRVLQIHLGQMHADEACASDGPVPEFKIKDSEWTAPYTPYAPGWWHAFEHKA
uniref:Ycf54-like protein n=2 Tax=Auxenochlorella protothecoides TaxID=3075 RepID=A0A1D2A6H1_AUXPR